MGAPKSVKIRRSDYFFCYFFLFIYFSFWFFVGNFFCCHLCLLVHWPQRYYCKFTRRAQSGLRPELELHLKALASSIAKPKRNALHSAVLLHGTMAGFCAVLSKNQIFTFCNNFVYGMEKGKSSRKSNVFNLVTWSNWTYKLSVTPDLQEGCEYKIWYGFVAYWGGILKLPWQCFGFFWLPIPLRW